jgi:glycosyltransferase involved in cell wall biosynthesis
VSTFQTPLVSIVIPAFNAAQTVAQTLESLRAQTHENFEAIIVDDGSTDDTATIVRKFCDVDSRFIFAPKPHSGLPGTRNAGIGIARGEFVAFLDADDVWLPEKLTRQMDLFRVDSRVNLAFTNFFIWDGQRDLLVYYRETRPLPDGDVSRQLLFSSLFGISSVVLRRPAFGGDCLFDASLRDGSEDWDLWLRLAGRGLFVRGTREPLMRYRRWPGNMSNRKLKMAESELRVIEKNLRASQRPELRSLYRRSLNRVRGRLELVRARQMLDDAPGKIPATIWRAWRFNPRHVKWLMWFVLAVWPKFLGGRVTEKIVHRKLAEKF